MKLFTKDQIRKWDQWTIHEESIPSSQLMERAASKAALFLFENYSPYEFLILCGRGNNGGDGLVIARLLNEKKVKVQVYILPSGRPSADFQLNWERIQNDPILIPHLPDPSALTQNKKTILLDCLLGTGYHPPLDHTIKELIQWIYQTGLPVISIDIPSGMLSDLEESAWDEIQSQPENAVRADYTLSFEVPKLSSLIPGFGEYYGESRILSIPLSQRFSEQEPSSYHFLDKHEISKIYKKRDKFGYKGNYGHSLIIAGSYGKAGAALLSTLAAVSIGSGLVSVLSPEINATTLQLGVPEAMFIPGGGDKFWNALPKELPDFNVCGIGPGLNQNPETILVFLDFLKNMEKPLVLDADALNMLSLQKNWKKLIPKNSILSPHIGEFNRLSGHKTNNPISRLKIAMELSQESQSILILKGANTAILFPDGEIYFNSTGNPGMATGGSGDVLTGILTGLLAQGYSAKEASLLGVFLHGLSGDLASEYQSQSGLRSMDLIDYLGPAQFEIEKIKSPF